MGNGSSNQRWKVNPNSAQSEIKKLKGARKQINSMKSSLQSAVSFCDMAKLSCSRISNIYQQEGLSPFFYTVLEKPVSLQANVNEASHTVDKLISNLSLASTGVVAYSNNIGTGNTVVGKGKKKKPKKNKTNAKRTNDRRAYIPFPHNHSNDTKAEVVSGVTSGAWPYIVYNGISYYTKEEYERAKQQDEEIAKKDETIKQQEQTINEKDQKINDQQNTINNQNNEINNLKSQQQQEEQPQQTVQQEQQQQSQPQNTSYSSNTEEESTAEENPVEESTSKTTDDASVGKETGTETDEDTDTSDTKDDTKTIEIDDKEESDTPTKKSSPIPAILGVGAAGAAGFAGVRYIKNKNKDTYNAEEYDEEEDSEDVDYSYSDDNNGEESYINEKYSASGNASENLPSSEGIEKSNDLPVTDETVEIENDNINRDSNNLSLDEDEDIKIEDDYEDDFEDEELE